MYNCSYGISLVGLCICFSSDIVSVRVPYSWMFRSMCWAYADWGSLFFYVSDAFAVSYGQITIGLAYV